MSIALANALHSIAAVLWVGGMFFAYLCLRPAMGALEPPARCTLWRVALGRFFAVVWGCVVALLLSGFYLIGSVFGGMKNVGPHVHIMIAVGVLMMLLFMHVQFGPFRKLKAAVAAEDWPAAGAQVGRIRPVVAINLGLGLFVVLVASGGAWF